MSWSDTAAYAAQQWASECNYAHGGIGFGTIYGQNIYARASKGNGDNIGPTAKEIIRAWTTNAMAYDLVTNTCLNDQDCSAYTQLIWSGTSKVSGVPSSLLHILYSTHY